MITNTVLYRGTESGSSAAGDLWVNSRRQAEPAAARQTVSSN